MYVALRRYGSWPWRVRVGDKQEIPEAGPSGYAVAELIRLLIGAGLAWASVATGQVAGPLGAIGVGVAAPSIIGQLAKALPLAITPQSPGADMKGSCTSQGHEENRVKNEHAHEAGER